LKEKKKEREILSARGLRPGDVVKRTRRVGIWGEGRRVIKRKVSIWPTILRKSLQKANVRVATRGTASSKEREEAI